jgi:hypothetical protein
MSSIKGHFDGYSIVLDEPATLAVGQPVRIVIDSSDTAEQKPPILGAWTGKLKILEDGDESVRDHFKDYLP